MKLNFWLSLASLLAQTQVASAALVQCQITSKENVLCSLCSFLATVQAVINFIIGLAFVGAVLLIAKFGLDMFFTGGNIEAVKKAGKGIWNTVLAVILVLSAWVIVNTIIWFFAKPGSPPTFWNQLNC